MKYIFKNISSFLKCEKMIFLLVLICIIISVFVIDFSYGLYQNYHVVKEESESELYEIEVTFNNFSNEYVSKRKLQNALLSFSDTLNSKTDMYLVNPKFEEIPNNEFNGVYLRFCIKNGRICPCEVFANNMETYGTLVSGRYFTKEEEENGERVALVFNDMGATNSITDNLLIDKDTILLQGEKYKVIGIQKIHPLIVPFNSIKEETPINGLLISFEKPITISSYNEVKSVLKNSFGDLVNIPELNIPESENYYLYNTIIVISILIALLAAINFAVLYKYILSKRTKKLAVFRICGCTKAKAFTMFISECMLLMIPLFVATTIVYDRFILPKLGDHFEYIESAYSVKLYLLIFMIYTLASAIVLSFMISGFLDKSIREAKEEK